jgi:hypothetical protein
MCVTGNLAEVVFKNHQCRMGGVDFIMPQAKVSICHICGERIVSCREYKKRAKYLFKLMCKEGVK